MIFDQASNLLLEYIERDVDAAEPIKSSSERIITVHTKPLVV